MIKILKAVCPSDHVQVMLAYDDERGNEFAAKMEICKLMSVAQLKCCGLCRVSKFLFTFKTSATSFTSMEEARQALQIVQANTLNQANLLKGYFESVRN